LSLKASLAVLKSATPTQSLSKAVIDGVSPKAAMEALGQIVKMDCHNLVIDSLVIDSHIKDSLIKDGPIKEGLKAKEIIDLGLSIYGSEAKVVAAFSP
jgi:hypothetical protein